MKFEVLASVGRWIEPSESTAKQILNRAAAYTGHSVAELVEDLENGKTIQFGTDWDDKIRSVRDESTNETVDLSIESSEPTWHGDVDDWNY